MEKKLVLSIMVMFCFLSVLTTSSFAITMTDMNEGGYTATDLAEALVGSGITVSNVTLTGNGPQAAGMFQDFDVIGISSGIVLSSGDINYLENSSNTSDNITKNWNALGDSDLNALIPGYTTYDAIALEFDFVAEGNPGDTVTCSFKYVFGSDEYDEYVGTAFNDVFGFFVNGTNVALIPGTTTPVSINNLNASNYSQYYNDNDPDIGAPYDTEMDGFTTVLYVNFDVIAGETNHMKIAIADAGDHILDSWVLIEAGSFTNKPIPEPTTMLLVSAGLIGIGFFSRSKFRKK